MGLIGSGKIFGEGSFFDRVGDTIVRGVGKLGQGAGNFVRGVVSGGFGSGPSKGLLGGASTGNSSFQNEAGILGGIFNREKRQDKKAGKQLGEWWYENKKWAIPVIIAIPVVGILIWVFSGKKKKVSKRRGYRATAKSRGVKNTNRARSSARSGKTFRTKPRSSWTAADKTAWAKWMQSKRKAKRR